MDAPPFQGIPYIQSHFPDQQRQQMPLPVIAMPKHNERPMDILSAMQFDDQAASRSNRLASNSQKHGRPPGGSQDIIFGLTGHFEQIQPDTQVKPRSSTQTSKSGTGEVNMGGERRRKKQKLSDDEDEPDDAAKKARGRPRLDTKDETAADRRRTQIRMAQRAYRHRKETTIASLEKQVQELRGTNEEMNNIFISLYDFAVGRGLLQREPEFGQHLQSSTQRFLALARSISDDQSKEDDSAGGESVFQGQSDPEGDSLNPSNHHSEISQSQNRGVQQVWGYQIEEEPFSEAPQQQQLQFDPSSLGLPNQQQDHQVVSRATADNASFSFDLLDDIQQFRAEVPDLSDNSHLFLNVEKNTSFLKSKTLSHQETSFARMLQRRAIEAGYKLITSENPNPALFNDVFGFCLRFSSKENIRRRLQSLVFSNSKDALYAWREPFVHIGGSGTHYPIHDQGISGDLQPMFRSGMSMGPFSPNVVEAKDNDFCDDFHTKVRGFEGEFFDANDVEGYLRGQGVDIPPNADFITLDLELLPAYTVPSLPSNTDSRSLMSLSPTTPRTPELRFTEPQQTNISNDTFLSGDLDNFSKNSNNTFNVDLSLSIDWANPVNPLDSSTTLETSTTTKGFNTSDNIDPFNLGGSTFNSFPPLQQTMSSNSITIDQGWRRGEERFVTVAVSVLIEEMLARAVCLGRAPGFRPSEVDAALRRTIQAAM